MKKWITKFKHWKFDKKLRLFETVSILLVALTVAGVSLSFFVAAMKEQSVELLQMQNNTVSESFRDSMNSYKELVLGTIMDDSVQNYCRQVEHDNLKTADINAIYSKLENLNNMYESMILQQLSVKIMKTITIEAKARCQLHSSKRYILRHI